jgi:hypothetical protein
MLIQFLKTKFHLVVSIIACPGIVIDQLPGLIGVNSHPGSDNDFILSTRVLATALSFFQIVRQTDRLDLKA